MRKIIGLIAVGLVLSVAVARAQEVPRHALAEEMLSVMNVQENFEKSFAMIKQMMATQMTTMCVTNMPENVSSQRDKMMDMVAKECSWDKMKADYIGLYATTYTEDEMKGAIAFFKSPAGQAYLKKQPELMKGSMALSQKMMMKIMPKIQAMTKELKETSPASAPTRK